MPFLSLTNVAFIFVVFVVIQCYRTVYRKGLQQLPGPPLARLTRFWKLRDALGGAAHLTNSELHKRFGPIVRIGPKHVSVNDPNEILVIYGVSSEFRKTNFYTLFSAEWEGKPLLDLFTTLSPTEHKNQKRNVSNAYAMSSMLAFEPLVDECIEILMNSLDRLRETGNAIDLGKWMQWYAFDVIGNITFSRRFGFMEQGIDVFSMIAQIEKGLEYAAVIGQIPEMHKVLLGNYWVKKCFASFQGLRKLNPLFNIIPFAKEEISKHSQMENLSGTSAVDFLSLLRAQQKLKPNRLTDHDILTHCVTNLLAGSDTTGITLRAILYMLIKHPWCYAKVQAEIDELDKKGALGSGVSFSQSLEMPYLQASMKEAMRLHPSVGFGLERYVPSGGATICGHQLPAGTVISMNAWAVHRNKAVFGEDADDFRPERWIEADEEKLKLMGRAFLTFGGGTRTCIGRNISILEISKVIPELLRQFVVELEPHERDWKVETWWFARQSGLICKLTPRRVGGLVQ